jgi:hypothetical protein
MCSAETSSYPIELELMTTSGCHLCDHAVEVLVQVLDPEKFTVDLVDIAYEDELMERYAERIPVLVFKAQKKELGWPFDQAQLSAFVNDLLSRSTVPG